MIKYPNDKKPGSTGRDPVATTIYGNVSASVLRWKQGESMGHQHPGQGYPDSLAWTDLVQLQLSV